MMRFTPQTCELSEPDRPAGAPVQLAFVNPPKPPPHPVFVIADVMGEYVPRTKPRQFGLENPVHFARTVEIHVQIREYAAKPLGFVPAAGGLVFPSPRFDIA